MSEEQKRKISDSLRGRKKPKSVRERISKGLRHYWSQIPYNTIEEDSDGENDRPNKG